MLIRILAAFPLMIACYAGPAWTAEKAAAAEPQKTEEMPVVFEDDFESGLDRWEFTDDNAWKIAEEDGGHVLSLFAASAYEPPVRSPVNIAWAKDLSVSDFVLDARLKQTGKEYGHRDLCLFFGRQDATHFYYVHIATKADDHANSIFLVNAEPRVSIAKERTDGTNWTQDYHHVRVERKVAEGTIRVFFDDMDKPIMTAQDTTFVAGPIGLGSFDDVGQFDDVVVRGRIVEKR